MPRLSLVSFHGTVMITTLLNSLSTCLDAHRFRGGLFFDFCNSSCLISYTNSTYYRTRTVHLNYPHYSSVCGRAGLRRSIEASTRLLLGNITGCSEAIPLCLTP